MDDRRFDCPPVGRSELCGPGDSCFCTKMAGGKSACVDLLSVTDRNELPACGSGTP